MQIGNISVNTEIQTIDKEKNISLAEQIRASRSQSVYSEERAKETMDIFEKSGSLKKVVYPEYPSKSKWGITMPCDNTEKEMGRVMDGYYDGKISKDDIKEFFVGYCTRRECEGRILDVYECFLNKNYSAAVSACWDEAKDIAGKEGLYGDNIIYYNADYYYKSEEIHELLKEIATEIGAKCGIEIDVTEREKNFQKEYLDGMPTFNSKWNFMAANLKCRGRMMDLNAVPPEGFSFFYKEGTDMASKGSILIITGNGWSEKINVPFEVPATEKKVADYFYLSDLFQVDSKKEENYKWYNDFLNTQVINRIRGSRVVIKRR